MLRSPGGSRLTRGALGRERVALDRLAPQLDGRGVVVFGQIRRNAEHSPSTGLKLD
jgi:hypothetical protein